MCIRDSLYGAIDGVQCYDRAFPTAVESSLNTGIVETTEDTVKIKFQVRSSVATKLDDMQNKLDLGPRNYMVFSMSYSFHLKI